MAGEAQADLDEALPALNAAMDSLKALNKNDITEIKSFAKPPPMVQVSGWAQRAVWCVQQQQLARAAELRPPPAQSRAEPSPASLPVPFPTPLPCIPSFPSLAR
jgi:hypothetical protein